MKIKCKVQKTMNLPQLIEWAWDNGIDSRTFKSPKGGDIIFDEYGDVIDVYSIKPNDTFTVEVEEEITEDTVIPEMLTIYFNGDSRIQNNKRLNDLNTTYHIKSAYIMNDDLRLILIWRDGKLVK